MKRLLLLLFSTAALTSVGAEKLTGTPIGTQKCVDYATGRSPRPYIP